MMITSSILFIITIIVVVVAIWIARKLLTNVKVWTPNRVSLFLAVYITAGIMAMIVLATMDNDIAILAEEELNAIDEAEQVFQETLNRAEYNQLDKKYIKQSIVYELQGDTFTLDVPNNGRFYDIIIERNNNPEVRDVVVKYYETPQVRIGIDLSGYIKQPTMQIENDTFYMEPFRREEIIYNKISPNIQLADYLFIDEYYQRDTFGFRVLYLNVPADVEIISLYTNE